MPLTAMPNVKFLISSNTTVRHRRDNNKLKLISDTGMPRGLNGDKKALKAMAKSSGGVVTRPRLALCNVTIIKDVEDNAKSKDFLFKIKLYIKSNRYRVMLINAFLKII